MKTHTKKLTNKHLFTTRRNEICRLQWIIEGYDGMASMRTIDPARGHIEISIAPGCEKEMFSLINHLIDEGSIHVTDETF